MTEVSTRASRSVNPESRGAATQTALERVGGRAAHPTGNRTVHVAPQWRACAQPIAENLP
jgi:hypothetical protein